MEQTKETRGTRKWGTEGAYEEGGRDGSSSSAVEIAVEEEGCHLRFPLRISTRGETSSSCPTLSPALHPFSSLLFLLLLFCHHLFLLFFFFLLLLLLLFSSPRFPAAVHPSHPLCSRGILAVRRRGERRWLRRWMRGGVGADSEHS